MIGYDSRVASFVLHVSCRAWCFMLNWTDVYLWDLGIETQATWGVYTTDLGRNIHIWWINPFVQKILNCTVMKPEETWDKPNEPRDMDLTCCPQTDFERPNVLGPKESSMFWRPCTPQVFKLSQEHQKKWTKNHLGFKGGKNIGHRLFHILDEVGSQILRRVAFVTSNYLKSVSPKLLEEMTPPGLQLGSSASRVLRFQLRACTRSAWRGPYRERGVFWFFCWDHVTLAWQPRNDAQNIPKLTTQWILSITCFDFQ